jgi:hypothetical protein
MNFWTSPLQVGLSGVLKLAEKLQQAEDLALAAHPLDALVQLGAERHDTRRVHVGHADVRQGRGDAPGVVELVGLAEVHRAAGVQEDPEVQLLLLAEELDVELVKARVDHPVHRAGIIARRVLAEVAELDAGALFDAGAEGLATAQHELAGDQVQPLQGPQEVLVEERHGAGG